ncbi:MAG: hypothetical protein LBU23_00500 [Planctomycetota bacterium]|jgi:hypothetical protein|nr:hypothetical protein [Planctomycetota bacterium]
MPEDDEILPDGLIGSGIDGLDGFALFAAPDNNIKYRIKCVTEIFYRGPACRKDWDMAEPFFLLFDAVTISEFVGRYVNYRFHSLGYETVVLRNEPIKESITDRMIMSIIMETLVCMLNDATYTDNDIFLAGAELVEGTSNDLIDWGDLVWLDMKKASIWFVRKSGMWIEEIPYSIREWVRKNTLILPSPALPPAPPVPLVQAAPALPATPAAPPAPGKDEANEFDPETMMTIKEITDDAHKVFGINRSRHFFLTMLKDAGVKPCFTPELANQTKGYPKDKVIVALYDMAKKIRDSADPPLSQS